MSLLINRPAIKQSTVRLPAQAVRCSRKFRASPRTRRRLSREPRPHHDRVRLRLHRCLQNLRRLQHAPLLSIRGSIVEQLSIPWLYKRIACLHNR